MKAIQSEKENVQGTNSEGKETGTQINGLEQTEERNIQSEKNEETRIQKSEERLRNLQDILKHSNILIIGLPEREEEEQQIENLFEQIMKENFPNLAKEIDFQEVQEAQRLPKKLDPKKHTARHIIITLAKIKYKEKIFFFIVIQLQLYAFSPHPSIPPQVNPPPSPTSTLPLGFVHVSFIVVPVIPSSHCPPRLLLDWWVRLGWGGGTGRKGIQL